MGLNPNAQSGSQRRNQSGMITLTGQNTKWIVIHASVITGAPEYAY